MRWSGCRPILDESPRTFLLDSHATARSIWVKTVGQRPHVFGFGVRPEHEASVCAGWHQIVGRETPGSYDRGTPRTLNLGRFLVNQALLQNWSDILETLMFASKRPAPSRPHLAPNSKIGVGILWPSQDYSCGELTPDALQVPEHDDSGAQTELRHRRGYEVNCERRQDLPHLRHILDDSLLFGVVYVQGRHAARGPFCFEEPS